jgi:hypothetical protein
MEPALRVWGRPKGRPHTCRDALSGAHPGSGGGGEVIEGIRFELSAFGKDTRRRMYVL